MTRLLVTHRTVPLDREDDYWRLWTVARAAMAEAGGRAWLFRSAGRVDRFLEFFEDPADAGLVRSDAVAAARADLHDSFPADSQDEWTEASRPEAVDE